MDAFLRKVSASTSSSEANDQDKNKKRKACKARKFGFTSTEVNEEERLLCVFCQAVLSAESMKPNKLKRHLSSQHKEHEGKPRSFFKLYKKEIRVYAIDYNKEDFVNFLYNSDQMWLLAYLSDIFIKLNNLNLSLQGKHTHILMLSDRINGFVKKLAFWGQNLTNRNYESFPQLSAFLTENHLQRLEERFGTFFIDLQDISELDWVRSPFLCQPDVMNLP
ncbi:ZBED5 protein, partial [Polyodon spathula]|nr:ZBED5 protein [Polyodon spathula]